MAGSGPGIRPRTPEMVRLSAGNTKSDAKVIILTRGDVDIVVGSFVRLVLRGCGQCGAEAVSSSFSLVGADVEPYAVIRGRYLFSQSRGSRYRVRFPQSRSPPLGRFPTLE